MITPWLLAAFSAAPSPVPATPSIAFWYAEAPPLLALDLYDWVVLEPDHLPDRRAPAFPHARPFAYVAVGEVQPSRAYAAQIPPAWRVGKNEAWGSWVMDLGRSEWRSFLLEQVIGPLVQAGYQGVFLDALDSSQAAATTPETRAARTAGLRALVEALHARYPELAILLNRGFDVLPEVADQIAGVVVESLYAGWDPKSRTYAPVSAGDRRWLLEQLAPARQAGRPCFAVDYLPPQDFGRGPALARQIRADGVVPWIADPALSRLGVGALEVMPREVLLLWDGKRHQDVAYSEVHRLVAMPLEHQGLVPVYADVHAGLPTGTLGGRYAGIVAWIGAHPVADPAALRDFFQRAKDEGVKIVFLGDFPGELDDNFLSGLGLRRGPRRSYVEVKIEAQGDLLGFEAPVRSRGRIFYPLRGEGPGFSSQLTLSHGGERMEAIGLAPWGGWGVEPHLLEEGPDGDLRWILDPFTFLERALALAPRPAIDPNTENGRRLAFFHIDGDGMASRAEMPGAPYAGEVIRRFLTEHRWPHAVSIVEGETSPHGLYPESSPELESIARQIFALPHVEVASHGYLHPFRWREFEARAGTPGLHLAIPGVEPSIPREINGSIEYINKLAPPEKPVRLFLWTGDALPAEATLAEVRRAGVRNMNGGVTEVTQDRPSLTRVWPMARPVGRELQVYAPVINENVYTNLWTGPYYGYRRVLETFGLTGAPRRLKPIDVYYHFYSGSKVAGQVALEEVYRFVEQGPHLPTFPSAWVDRVEAFRRAVIARDLDGGYWLAGLGPNRTLRTPTGLGWPKLEGPVIGCTDDPTGRYVWAQGAERVHLRLEPSPPPWPYLVDADVALTHAEWKDHTLELAWGEGPATIRLAGPGAERCRVEGRKGRAGPTVSRKVATFLLQESESRRARLICR